MPRAQKLHKLESKRPILQIQLTPSSLQLTIKAMVDYTEAAFAGQELEFLEHYNLNMNRTPDFLPPGFRFHPSDEELIIHYLMNKVTSTTLPATIITDIDLYKHDPWDLPMQASYGDEEWFFFTQRERKYPNGVRPNRAAGSGYWKATGTDKPIIGSCGTKSIGLKKGLVFYTGRPPKGTKTDWIMHEYRLPDTILWTPKTKGSLRLDDWVLCRVRQKSSNPGVRHDSPQIFLATNSFQTDAVLANLYASSPSVTNSSTEMAKHYDLYNEGFPMLPYMLASHANQHQSPDLQPSSSAISFQTSEKSCISSILDEGLLLPGPTKSLFNFRNSMKRKAEDSFMPHCKGVDTENVTSLSTDFNSQQLNSFKQFEGFNGLEL